jgi:hypothetical protein
MFEKCTNCTMRVVKGKKDQNGIFCSAVCQAFFRHPGFCQNCNSSTTPDSAGSTFTLNGIGTKIYGGKDPCPECASTIQTKWFVVLFIPLIPIAKYRTKWCTPGRYISRKVNKKFVTQQATSSAHENTRNVRKNYSLTGDSHDATTRKHPTCNPSDVRESIFR